MNRLQQAPSVMAADLSERQVVMMDVDLNSFFGLEDTAVEIWRMFATPRTADEVVAELTAAYDVEPERCRQETAAFIDALVERQLLTSAD